VGDRAHDGRYRRVHWLTSCDRSLHNEGLLDVLVAILLRVVRMSSTPLIPCHEPTDPPCCRATRGATIPGRGHRTPHRTGVGSSAYPAGEPSLGSHGPVEEGPGSRPKADDRGTMAPRDRENPRHCVSSISCTSLATNGPYLFQELLDWRVNACDNASAYVLIIRMCRHLWMVGSVIIPENHDLRGILTVIAVA
jgi:hypothetical protein